MTNAAREARPHGHDLRLRPNALEGAERHGPQRRDPGVGPGLDEPACQDEPPVRQRLHLDRERDDFTNGDLTITYAVPVGVTDTDPRTGQTITVRAIYHQDLIIPLVAALLPLDAGGRLALPGEVTMVIN